MGNGYAVNFTIFFFCNLLVVFSYSEKLLQKSNNDFFKAPTRSYFPSKKLQLGTFEVLLHHKYWTVDTYITTTSKKKHNLKNNKFLT